MKNAVGINKCPVRLGQKMVIKPTYHGRTANDFSFNTDLDCKVIYIDYDHCFFRVQVILKNGKGFKEAFKFDCVKGNEIYEGKPAETN